MTLRKIFVVSVAAFATMSGSIAMADSLYAREPVTRPANIGYYVEGQVGYGQQNYFSDVNWSRYSGVTNNNNGNVYGGFTGGLDGGYIINNNFAAELGWFYLPAVNVAGINSLGNPLSSVDLTSWLVYLAAKYKVQIPWVDNTDWFFKLGVAYRRAEVSNTAVVSGSAPLPISSGSSNFVRPMFATGLTYNFADVWMAVFQYAYYMGSATAFPYNGSLGTSTSSAMGVEGVNAFTVGLGYKFIL